MTVGLRPEALELASDGAEYRPSSNSSKNSVPRRTSTRKWPIKARARPPHPEIVVRVAPTVVVKSGDRITLRVKDDSMLLFDAETGIRIVRQ